MKRITQRIAESPARSLFVWFLGLIVAGTLLLMLPISHAENAAPFSFSDVAFTATSASCVNGLAVRSTAGDFSFFGQLVILTLIQLSGLGIITVAIVFVVDLTGRSTSAQRAVVEETLGLPAKADLSRYVNGVVTITLLAECLGAIALTARRAAIDSPSEAVWWGVFHSISAFCNAGFALDDESLSKSVADPTVNLVIITLVLVGGLGYPVLRELLFLPKRSRGTRWASLTFHAKLTLTASALLVTVGGMTFWLLERNNTLSELSSGGVFWASLFQGITPRSAGFNTLPLAELSNATLVVIMLLMFIGGNSCSTAGGTKVSTFAVYFLDMAARLRGRKTATLFGYRIPRQVVNQAAIVVLGYLLFATMGVMTIVCIEEHGIPHSASGGIFLDSVFEVFSAIATTGISTGLTPKLSEPSRWVIMFLMFAGRIGPLAMVTALSRPDVTDERDLPEANPLIG